MTFYMNFDTVKISVLLMALLMSSAMLRAEEAVSTSGRADPAAGETVKQTTYYFPGWPEQPPVRREIIPPPPPGPYMSLALSNFSSIEPAFGNETRKENDAADPSVVVDAFSPDRPWPKILRPVKRWMPEDGYRYVNSKPGQKSYSAEQNRSSANYNSGYRPAPYSYPRNYAPAYYYPVANNPGVQSGYQPYRAPYAATNKP